MAKKRNPSNSESENPRKKKFNSSSVSTNLFMKGMNKDVAPSFEKNDVWFHAINAANDSSDGDVGVIGNEPANLQCGVIPYTIIGAVHRYGDEWVVYSTDDVSSEIGRFDDSECKYTVIVNDPCLNFNRKHLITGAGKENFDCTWQVYWDDGNNPSRSLNIDNVPWIQDITSAPNDPCIVYEDTTFLNCEKIRLHPLVDTPCLLLSKATDGGTIENGSYQAYVAYTENEQVVSDYIGISNVQTLWSHRGTNSSLDIDITNLDKDYFYFDLVLLIRTQGQIYTKLIGNYSTETSHINIDYVDQALVSVSLEELFRLSPAYEKSDAMYVVNDYLIRQGPTEQFDFNYQPLANAITSSWVINEVSESYYYNAGNKMGFMRDEQYAFFIRWIYNTGERSSSYHIPGRAPVDYTLPSGIDRLETAIISGTNTVDTDEPLFKVYNTGSVSASNLTEVQADGSNIIARGKMGYWESTEKYPDKKPEVWGDLCGQYIRHHKMPSEMIGGVNSPLHITNNLDTGIHILGVEFSNIERPKNNDGSYITNITGYEILRGSRLGNKSILAKGMFKNMRKYTLPTQDNLIGNAQGLYPNYPYNDLRGDVYHTTTRKTEGCDDVNDSVSNYPSLTGITEDVFTFHSPELMFTKPFLNAYETVFYGQIDGKSSGYFTPSENHPQFKLLRNIASYLAAIIGIGYALRNINGTPNTRSLPTQAINNAYPEWLINEIDGKKQTGGGGNITATVPPAVATAFLSPRSGGQISGGDGDNNEKGPGAETNAHEAITDLHTALGGNPFSIGGIWAGITDLINDFAGDALQAAGLSKSTQQNIQEQGVANIEAAQSGSNNGMGLMGGGNQEGVELNSSESNLGAIFKGAISVILLQKNIAVGGQEIIDLIYNLADFQEYVLKYNSHGLYNNFSSGSIGNLYRTKNEAANYIGSSFQTFDNNKYKINNLFRPNTVAVSTVNPISSNYNVEDKSRFVLGGYVNSSGNGVNDSNWESNLLDPEGPFSTPISALYGALKFNIDNQYGQLDGIKQLQMRGCVEPIGGTYSNGQPIPNSYLYTSKAIFSGDVFISRYTEKCIMPIFTDYLMGQYDGFTYDYYLRANIPWPRYWIDSRKFDMSAMASVVGSFGLNLVFNPDLDTMPNDNYYLDRGDTCGFNFSIFGGDKLNKMFSMNHAYMYTHVNGINDFYVETEINLPYRDWEEPKERRFYDQYEYNNLRDLFHAEIQKFDNFYKYDESLSPSKFVNQQSNFAELQTKDYDPLTAESCYTYYPKRLIYSIRANEEDKKDYWRQYLFANQKDFKNKVSVIKPFSSSGALIFFPYQSPQLFRGVDTLKTGADLKLTIGDGGLFSQPMQNVANSDISNEYGSLESGRGVINTPAGLFFISQAQGKIFQYAQKGLDPISNSGMKWWFNKYLPSALIKQFPALEFSKLSDNPVIGIGCQAIYDPNDDIVYFMKKDYRVRNLYISGMTYSEKAGFVYNSTSIIFGNPVFFEDCSWTISYDPKSKAWISFHDWHPEFALPSINHFFTTKTIDTTIPQCPPGYVFNPVSGLCEDSINITEPASVTVEEIAATVTGGPQDCLVDIVIAIDASGSTNWINGNSGNSNNPNVPTPGLATRGRAEMDWLEAFVDDPAIQAGLSGGQIQIGYQVWATNTAILDPASTGDSMQGVVTGAQARAAYVANWTGQNGIAGQTNPQASRTNGIVQLDNKAGSSLSANYPARSSDAFFKQILIIVTDGTAISTGGDPLTPQSFDTLQSPDVITGAGGPIKQQLMGVFVGINTSIVGNPTIINQTTVGAGAGPGWAYYGSATDSAGNSQPANTPGPNQFAMNAASPSSLTATANAIAGAVCTIPYNCSCPTGYDLIYLNSASGFYDGVSGVCDDITPPVCRKASCECPVAPSGTVTTNLGTCPDSLPELAYIGDPNWVDPTPPLCNFYYFDSVVPNYKVGSFWRHNVRCDSFANFYGVDYPWEVELISNTGQSVNTIRSIEYQLETYVFKGEPEYNLCGGDKWEDLDFNFDKAIIYNNDQVSGLLNVVMAPFNDPWNALGYPILTPNFMTVLSSKVEHKFRINQFWDITNDRGEFTNAEQSVFDTSCNGYIRPLNNTNLDYFKSSTQRKKFRHYSNHVLLRRQVSGSRKMLLRLNNTKLLLSQR